MQEHAQDRIYLVLGQGEVSRRGMRKLCYRTSIGNIKLMTQELSVRDAYVMRENIGGASSNDVHKVRGGFAKMMPESVEHARCMQPCTPHKTVLQIS